MPDAKSILSTTLLSLQLCLGFWQIGKLTPVGALIQCGVGWLLSYCPFTCGLSVADAYRRLRHFEGRTHKTVRCHITTDQPALHPRREREGPQSEITSSYLRTQFRLQRRGEHNHKLYVDGRLCYYITDPIWNSLLDFAKPERETVFLKGYKEFWQQVATGGVMSLSEVLDKLILENHSVRILDNDLLLPVNLSVSEEKVLKALNLAGLFLQTRKVHWLIPLLVSFTAALLEFSTSVRAWLYERINVVFCWVMHLVCDMLGRAMRRQVYSFGNWVEGLKPSNDLKLRIVRGDICAVIGGGAKVSKEDAVLFEGEDLNLEGGATRVQKTIPCGKIDDDYRPIDIECWFDATEGKCHLRATTVALADLDCNEDNFAKLCNFLTCVAKNQSGSLKSCDSKNKVRVRGFRETVACYSKNGFPPVYELKLGHAVVQ